METCCEDTYCEFEDGRQNTRKLAISRQEIFGDKMQQLKNRTKTHKNNGGKGIIDCAGQTQDKALALASDA